MVLQADLPDQRSQHLLVGQPQRTIFFPALLQDQKGGRPENIVSFFKRTDKRFIDQTNLETTIIFCRRFHDDIHLLCKLIIARHTKQKQRLFFTDDCRLEIMFTNEMNSGIFIQGYPLRKKPTQQK